MLGGYPDRLGLSLSDIASLLCLWLLCRVGDKVVAVSTSQLSTPSGLRLGMERRLFRR